MAEGRSKHVGQPGSPHAKGPGASGSSGRPEGACRARRTHHAGRNLNKRACDVVAYFDRPGTSNGPTEAINGRLQHLRGFRNLTSYTARSLLETGSFRPTTTPSIVKSQQSPRLSDRRAWVCISAAVRNSIYSFGAAAQHRGSAEFGRSDTTAVIARIVCFGRSQLASTTAVKTRRCCRSASTSLCSNLAFRGTRSGAWRDGD
jgi:Transposase